MPNTSLTDFTLGDIIMDNIIFELNFVVCTRLAFRIILRKFVIVIDSVRFQVKIHWHIVKKRGIDNVVEHSASKALLRRSQYKDCNLRIVLKGG